jgi:hypothetical protein
VDPRADLAGHQAWDVSPLPLTGATAGAMDAWSPVGVTHGAAGECTQRGRPHARGHAVRAAEGSACARTCRAPGSVEAGSARGLGGRSPRHAPHQAAGLATRLRHAEPPLTALTPPSGRGNRHITDAATRVEAMARVLRAHRVEGLLSVVWAKQGEPTTPYVGRGRGAVHREQRVSQPTRSPIPHSARQEDTSAAHSQRCGWQACVTHAGHPPRSVPAAVWCSRNAYRVERLCNRLKSRGHLAPLCVKRNEHMEGRTSLLTRGVRG